MSTSQRGKMSKKKRISFFEKMSFMAISAVLSSFMLVSPQVQDFLVMELGTKYGQIIGGIIATFIFGMVSFFIREIMKRFPESGTLLE